MYARVCLLTFANAFFEYLLFILQLMRVVSTSNVNRKKKNNATINDSAFSFDAGKKIKMRAAIMKR